MPATAAAAAAAAAAGTRPTCPGEPLSGGKLAVSRRQRRIKYVQDIDYGDGDDINDDDPGCVRNPRTGSD
eukprot:2450136-Prymnesium_polylepis.1